MGAPISNGDYDIPMRAIFETFTQFGVVIVLGVTVIGIAVIIGEVAKLFSDSEKP